jgi:hypothetical protein
MIHHAPSTPLVASRFAAAHRPLPRLAKERPGPKTNFAYFGSSVVDLYAADDVVVELFDDGIELSRPGEPYSYFIATDRRPVPGAKVNARQPIRSDAVGRFIDDTYPGGGGLNQALALTSIACQHAMRVQVTLFDTAEYSPPVASACAARGVRLVPLARHRTPVNLVLRFQAGSGRNVDKLVIRSPLEPLSDGIHCERTLTHVHEATCLAVISPKDATDISDILEQAHGEIYFQPTGSLDVRTTHELAEQASRIVTNFDELGNLAIPSRVPWPEIAESAPGAPQIAKEALRALWLNGVLGRDLAVTTLGRGGCLVVDFQREENYHHRVQLTNGHAGVATRNGAGDRWLAEYMYCREVEQLGDPTASYNATGRVAVWLGLKPNEFTVETTSI